jgi:hypothetical protein
VSTGKPTLSLSLDKVALAKLICDIEGFPTSGHDQAESSSAFALAWRNYSPRSITPPRFYEHFCVPLRLGANWGYIGLVTPSSTREEESITNYVCFSLQDGVFCLPLA